MRRYVLAVDLKDDPGVIAAYREYHRHVWPEVVGSLRRAGIVTMDIYVLERRAVMVLETDGRDPAGCFAMHQAAGPRVAEWEALMKSLQQPPPGGQPGDWWVQMEPLFSLESQADTSVASGRAGRA
jgi:L-rhamnose mutarotase